MTETAHPASPRGTNSTSLSAIRAEAGEPKGESIIAAQDTAMAEDHHPTPGASPKSKVTLTQTEHSAQMAPSVPASVNGDEEIDMPAPAAVAHAIMAARAIPQSKKRGRESIASEPPTPIGKKDLGASSKIPVPKKNRKATGTKRSHSPDPTPNAGSPTSSHSSPSRGSSPHDEQSREGSPKRRKPSPEAHEVLSVRKKVEGINVEAANGSSKDGSVDGSTRADDVQGEPIATDAEASTTDLPAAETAEEKDDHEMEDSEVSKATSGSLVQEATTSDVPPAEADGGGAKMDGERIVVDEEKEPEVSESTGTESKEVEHPLAGPTETEEKKSDPMSAFTNVKSWKDAKPDTGATDIFGGGAEAKDADSKSSGFGSSFKTTSAFGGGFGTTTSSSFAFQKKGFNSHFSNNPSAFGASSSFTGSSAFGSPSGAPKASAFGSSSGGFGAFAASKSGFGSPSSPSPAKSTTPTKADSEPSIENGNVNGNGNGNGNGKSSSESEGEGEDGVKVKSFDEALREGATEGKSKTHLAMGGVTEADRLEGFVRQQVATGEEDWDLIKASRCRLFVLGKDKSWHERGYGVLKVLQHLDSRHRYRLVMRADAVFHLILNAPLIHSFGWTTPADKMLSFVAPGDDAKPQPYLLKFARADAQQELINVFEDCLVEIRKTATPERSSSIGEKV